MSAPEQIWAWCFQDIEGAWADWGGYARPTNMHPLDKREQITGAQYTRTDLIPAMIREAVQHEFAELMDAVRSIADDNNRIEMDVFDACEAIIRARKGGE